MRRFLVASCCVIVALQVLIGVPLAVCIGFYFSLVPHRSILTLDAPSVQSGYPYPTYSTDSSPVAYAPADLCTTCPSPATSPAPSYNSPSYSPVPVASTPPQRAWTPAPAEPTSLPPASIPAGLAPIVDSRAQYGSPLAASSLAPSSPAEGIREFVAALDQVAATEPNPEPDPQPQTPQPAAAALDPSIKNGVGNSPVSGPATLVESLRTSVQHLYALAQNLEADGNFGRADQIRVLTREIRSEIDIISRDLRREPAVSSALPTVTEAAWNPEPPPAPAPELPPPPVPVEPPPAPPAAPSP